MNAIKEPRFHQKNLCRWLLAFLFVLSMAFITFHSPLGKEIVYAADDNTMETDGEGNITWHTKSPTRGTYGKHYWTEGWQITINKGQANQQTEEFFLDSNEVECTPVGFTQYFRLPYENLTNKHRKPL